MILKRILLSLFWLVFVASLVLYAAAFMSYDAASAIDRKVCIGVRGLLAGITNVFPFSFFELLLLLSLPIIVLTVLYMAKGRVRIASVISVLTLVPSLYILTLGISYSKQTIADTYSSNVTNEEMYLAAEHISARLAELDGYTESSLEEVSLSLTDAYRDFAEGSDIGFSALPRPKPVFLSKALSRLGILALYSFMTGEVNINTDIPKYMIPFTVGHEYAHALGANGEAESDFISFLVCVGSGDEYLEYSALVTALEYILSDIYALDSKMYKDLYRMLPDQVISDMQEYSLWAHEYSHSFVKSTSDKINSVYLNAVDPSGADAYSALTRYVTNYFISA